MSDEIVSGTTRSVLERRSVGTLLQSDGVGQADNFDVTGTERRGIVVRSREGRKRSRDSSTRQRPVPEDTSSPETRDALRRLSDSACRSSAQMVLAAEGDDPMSLSNAANDLESMLADMWELRERVNQTGEGFSTSYRES